MVEASAISASREGDLQTLRKSTLSRACWMALALAYVWFLAHIWLADAGREPQTTVEVIGPWAGLLVLIISGAWALHVRDRNLQRASWILTSGLEIAVFLALVGYSSLRIGYLWALPILFSSVLLRPNSAFVIAGVALVGLRVSARTGAGPVDASVFAGAVLLALAVASYVFSRNLYTALQWTWDEWQRAGQHEREALERRAELRRALRALDSATARLERTNYMLALARDQAQEARRLKQQFAQTLSHELRTPLNLITGFADLMVQSPEYYGAPLPVAYRHDLAIVHRNANHLKALVDDVLDLARIDAAQMSLVVEETTADALVGAAVGIVRSLVESRGVALIVEIEPGLPTIHVDQTRIRQVLVNLLNNAARFTDKGSITVSAYRDKERIVFSVSDTGVGIPADELTSIFDEFHQVDGTSRRRHQGAGLGLAICQRFVEMHGGRIWAESTPGSGSTFFFALSTAQPDKPLFEPTLGLKPTQRADIRSDRPIAIAVTHSPAAAGLLGRYLSDSRTVVVSSLAEAACTALRTMPQAIVVDTTSHPGSQNDPALLLSHPQLAGCMGISVPLPGEESQRRHLDADGYLLKPVSRQSLWDALRRFGERVDRILLVDDDDGFVQLMRRLLQDPVRRYQVQGVGSGTEALAAIERQTPDLVLLDLMLPDMTGDQVLATIRGDQRWPHLPVIIVSAQDDPGQAQALQGPMTISRAGGLLPSQALRLLQATLETASGPDRSRATP